MCFYYSAVEGEKSMAYMKKRQSTTISVFEIGLFFFVNALLTFDLI